MEAKKKNKGKITGRFKKWWKKLWRSEDSVSFNIVEVIVVVVIAILFGIIVGCILAYGKGFVRTNDSLYVQELVDTYEGIVDNYYDGVDEETLVNAAINGMVGSLDDSYSYYMDENETFDFNQRVDGSYVGIGATISYSESGNSIIEIFDDSPAEKSGLQVGDIILSVGDTNVVGYQLSELSALLIGDIDTKVKIKVLRNDEEKTVTLTRGTVIIPSVNSQVIDYAEKKIGYIDIDTFAANTYSQFDKQLRKLEEDNIDSLIIDVRDNLGGHLSQVNKILSLFFDKKTVLYQIGTKDTTEKVYSSGKEKRDYDIVVLINYNSASASEILASCFQENYDRATIVGLQSYGKGTIQNAIQLSTGSSLKYTTQRWLTSSGVWLDGIGVTPDEEVGQEDDLYTVLGDNDTQFRRALAILGE
ncbi:MAG: S41 family peptidase [bacterium]|nr:S41 family peptidase [bacterium]